MDDIGDVIFDVEMFFGEWYIVGIGLVGNVDVMVL